MDWLYGANVSKRSPQFVLRLLIAEIYGVRCTELATLESKHIDLDKKTITFLVLKKKRGTPVPFTQPIPAQLLPFFDGVDITPMKAAAIIVRLKRTCKKAGIAWPYKGGVHSIRRRVFTLLQDAPGIKEFDANRFMRESVSAFGMIETYYQRTETETDEKILSVHPMVHYWTELACLLPYVPKYTRTFMVK